MPYCGKCGNEIMDGDAFCTRCGAKLNLNAVGNEKAVSRQDESIVNNDDTHQSSQNSYHPPITLTKQEQDQERRTGGSSYPPNESNTHSQNNQPKTENETIEVEYTAWFGKIPYRNIYHTIELNNDDINIIKSKGLSRKCQSMVVPYSDIRNISVSRKYGIFDMIGAVAFACFFFVFLFDQSYIMALLMIACMAVELSTGICSEVTISYGSNGLIEIPINKKAEAENLANKLYGRIKHGNNNIRR